MAREISLELAEIANGEVLGYRVTGKGDQVMVLVHGNMTSSKHWDLVLENMPDEYQIYAPDLRGFGISSYHQPISSLKDFSEDLKLWVDSIGLESFALGGWSTGGGVAMQFAADYPEYVTKLILIESVGISGYPILAKDAQGQPIPGQFLKTKEEIAADPVQVAPVLAAQAAQNKDFLRMLWDMVIYTQNKPEENKYQEYLEDMLTQRNLVDVDYALATFNISSEHNGVVSGSGDVAKIACPTLIIQGEKDLVVPVTMALGIKEGLGAKAELVILENSGHSPLIDSLDRLIELLVKFTRAGD